MDFLSQNVHTCFGTNTVTYSMGTGDISPSVKWPEHSVDHSRLSRAEVKNAWSYTTNTHLCLQVLERIDDTEVCLYL